MIKKHEIKTIPLGGEWSFATSEEDGCYTCAEQLQASGIAIYPCHVPGNLEQDLQQNGLIEDPFFGMNIVRIRDLENKHVWYFKHFTARDRPDAEALLIFEGIDCFAEIFLNGEKIGETDNMLIEHEFKITGKLLSENEIFVHIKPAVKEAEKFDYPCSLAANCDELESLYVRKAPHMYGWDIMPRAVSAGIWRPVHISFRPKYRIEQFFVENKRVSAESAELILHYRVNRFDLSPTEIVIHGECGDSVFDTQVSVSALGGRIFLNIPHPRLWYPRGKGEPSLYTITVELVQNHETIDQWTLIHGIKQAEIERTSVTDENGSGEFLIKINGERVFVLGTNWVPMDAYHSRDKQRLPAALDMVWDVGCNLIRCWGGNVYEDELFFDFCDQHGIMVWQDFAIACSWPPQDKAFQSRMEKEVRAVARRLRHHACLILWCGDNEVDSSAVYINQDPNHNVITRQVIPAVLRDEDWVTPYLPSSPYIDPICFKQGIEYSPENHPWGPRDYFKGEFYSNILCHFASEIGYHGCPHPDSLKKFISEHKLWPYQQNEEWLIHSTNPFPEAEYSAYRVELMARQIRSLFGEVPDNLDDFCFASQSVQLEAMKHFIEMFRTGKWRRTGIIWWNLIDGWPQISDAVVDYYGRKKLAYYGIKNAQRPVLLALKESKTQPPALVAVNDLRTDTPISWCLERADNGQIIQQGECIAAADEATVLAEDLIPIGEKSFYRIKWQDSLGKAANYYLAGDPPFDLDYYRKQIMRSFLDFEDIQLEL